MNRWTQIVVFFLLGQSLTAQIILGTVTNEFEEPLPFANVFVQQLGTGTTTDDLGRYELRFRQEGEYHLAFTSLGYESMLKRIMLEGDTVWVNVRLQTSGLELQEITVSASERDPAFAIIRKVIEQKDKHLDATGSYRVQVYMKAVEESSTLNDEPEREPAITVETGGEGFPFEDEAMEFDELDQTDQELLDGLNMVELALTLNHAYPRKYKEERTAYQEYGNTDGLFVPVFAETDFNFYRNMVHLPGISDAPVISPLSNNAILSYKYELVETVMEGDQMVYQIRIIPRKAGNSTVTGTLWINEGHWTVNRLSLDLPSGTLRFSDAFTIEQSYSVQEDSSWVIDRQAFLYETKVNRRKSFIGSTVLSYTDYELDYEFPERFFGNEVAVTTREAYDRSGQYWADARTESLASDESRMVFLRDSIQAYRESPAYRDSVEERYNKISLLELAWDGVGLRNWREKTHIFIGPLASMVDFSPVGGWRVGPYVSRFKRYANGRIWSNSGTVDVGLRNGDIQGNFSSWFRYDPFRMGDVAISGGRSFEAFNEFDAYLNLLQPSNYYLRDALRIGQQIEIVNGLRFNTTFDYSDRRPITGFDTGSFIDGWVGDEDAPVDFARYQAFISTTELSFTPGQRYMREPDRKVILGSNWPTFSLMHQRGWDGAFGSDIRFDYLEAAVEQKLTVGAIGQSHYRAQVGQFVNTDDLRFVDWKRFRQSDPVLYSNPLNTFQSLDTSLNTTNLHFEMHYIHHFNGAIINNIPLLKKSGITTVFGGGMLWLRDGDYRHQEVFAGIERVFKIGARRRLRVGLFGVLSDANDRSPNTAFKVSFDLIDIWKRDWSF
ncbi:MAG: DUF5686 and carboxypeptidase regulatory-like domain-containing protein [Bacteroidota bacterium]